MNELNDIEKGQLCQSTVESLYEATGGLSQFPGLLKRIIECRAWERRVNKGRVIELSSLRELITEKPVAGWGEDPKRVEAVIKDDPVALTMFREAMKQQPGPKPNRSGDNITRSKTEKGTSKAYTLSRLERESPELFQAVCDGELSANAAAIKAGFRKPPPSNEEKCLSAFKRSERRCELLRAIVLNLESHEWEFAKEVRQGNG